MHINIWVEAVIRVGIDRYIHYSNLTVWPDKLFSHLFETIIISQANFSNASEKPASTLPTYACFKWRWIPSCIRTHIISLLLCSFVINGMYSATLTHDLGNLHVYNKKGHSINSMTYMAKQERTCATESRPIQLSIPTELIGIVIKFITFAAASAFKPQMPCENNITSGRGAHFSRNRNVEKTRVHHVWCVRPGDSWYCHVI